MPRHCLIPSSRPWSVLHDEKGELDHAATLRY